MYDICRAFEGIARNAIEKAERDMNTRQKRKHEKDQKKYGSVDLGTFRLDFIIDLVLIHYRYRKPNNRHISQHQSSTHVYERLRFKHWPYTSQPFFQHFLAQIRYLVEHLQFPSRHIEFPEPTSL
jgi:hypothetical protein